MKRDGWEARLAAAIEAARGRPFAWGSHDCAIWTFDVVSDLTGRTSEADAWRGKYRTAAGAARYMRRRGWLALAEGATALLGPPLPTPLLAQRGDVLLGGADPALGVCVGPHGVFLAPEGLTQLPLTACREAWRV